MDWTSRFGLVNNIYYVIYYVMLILVSSCIGLLIVVSNNQWADQDLWEKLIKLCSNFMLVRMLKIIRSMFNKMS